MSELEEIFLYWIKERESIREKKEAGLPKPWSTDPIFQTYKFCNVRREDDTVSRWLFEHWMKPYEGHPNMWFAMVVARLFNWPQTLDLIGFPDLPDKYDGSGKFMLSSFNDWKERARRELKRVRDDDKSKVFTGAYLVSTNGIKMDKIDYILDRVLTPIWKNGCSPQHLGESAGGWNLEDYWDFLTQFDGLGSFMAGQVVADLKFIDPVLKEASDWWSWAPLGPGSIRGLNRLHNRKLEKQISQEQGLKEMLVLQELVENRLGLKLALHNLQNCLCETDKFIRVMNGEGRPRSTYPGVR